ncbi:MAG: DUF2804 family protein [Actinobacteria bacterium]|nr:MAG: DUF2804 family protein [Actinomycetota bacterium]
MNAPLHGAEPLERLPYRGPGRRGAAPVPGPPRRWRGAPARAGGPPSGLALPPHDRLARWRAGRPLKRWRYVGVFGSELMICVGDVRVGPARQTFWALWDRTRRRLHQRTGLLSHRHLELSEGRVRVRQGGVCLELEIDEDDGVETVCRAGRAYTWTRKQGGVAARGEARLDGRRVPVKARAVIDDSAGYHPRPTRWRWSAAVGEDQHGQPLAWNLVSGINDPPRHSERTLWVAGEPSEVAPVHFAEDLSAIVFEQGERLAFSVEARRARRDNLLLVRSDYEQPFGTFSGVLPGGTEVREGRGVMERHEAFW